MKIDRDLLTKISEIINRTIDQMADGVDTVADTARTRLAMVRIQRQIDDKFEELGRLVYRSCQEGQGVDEKVLNLCHEITILEREMQYWEEQGGKNEKRQCGQCGLDYQPGDLYCRRCGAALSQ